MDFDELYIMNPWWDSDEAIRRDKHIVSFEKSEFKYYPENLFREIDIKNPGIYTLRGPRQIGKTTFLKLFIKKLIDEGLNSRNIFFLTCEGIRDRFELIEIIKIYFHTFQRDKNDTTYLLLDEITTIKDWQLSIKYLADIGLFDNSILILTGSSSYDLKRSSERLPGRKGLGKDLVYLPIGFYDFLKSLNVKNIERLSFESIFHFNYQDLKSLEFKYSHIKKYFFQYMKTGGFPKVINDFFEYGKIRELTKSIYKDFIFGDAEKYLISRVKITEILKKLPDIIGQRFSWRSLLDHFSNSAESVETIQKYFEYLGYSFILATIFYVDISKKVLKPKKQKKVYPLDQIIVYIIEDISGKKIPFPQQIEIVTLNHLIRNSDISYNGLNLYNGPYYWYSDRGKEIDFIFEYLGELIPVEVKYQNKISKFDYLSMKKVFGKGILLTKDFIFKDENIIGLPIWLFLYILH